MDITGLLLSRLQFAFTNRHSIFLLVQGVAALARQVRMIGQACSFPHFTGQLVVDTGSHRNDCIVGLVVSIAAHKLMHPTNK